MAVCEQRGELTVMCTQGNWVIDTPINNQKQKPALLYHVLFGQQLDFVLSQVKTMPVDRKAGAGNSHFCLNVRSGRAAPVPGAPAGPTHNLISRAYIKQSTTTLGAFAHEPGPLRTRRGSVPDSSSNACTKG